MKSVFNYCLDFIYPRSCQICDAPMLCHSNRHHCDECLNGFQTINESFCKVCGRPFHGNTIESAVCSECEAGKFSYRGARSLFLMRSLEREFIHQLKYKKGSYLKEDFLKLLRSNLSFYDYLEESTLIPVPLFRSSYKERGYNQSSLVCKWISEEISSCEVADVLIRTRKTQTQTKLNRSERIRNVKNAFAIVDNFVLDLDHKWIVFDDVFTTGATVGSCCDILQKYNNNNLYVATLGHG